MNLLPADLEERLPRIPRTQRRVILGGDVLLIDTERNLILDVVENVAGE
jgi:hypothetical protein